MSDLTDTPAPSIVEVARAAPSLAFEDLALNYVSPTQAGAVLGVHRSRIHQFIGKGRLHSVTVFGRKYIHRDDLARVVRGPNGRPPKPPS